jgi:prepilin-type N-terminal cleavage/methylation domain-containing protein
MKPMKLISAKMILMQPNGRPARRRGFTLIELLVVISIIGVIASFTLVALGGINKNKKISTARGELAQIETALENYKAKYGVYPPGNQSANSFYTGQGMDRSQFSQLYYELSGTTNTGSYFVTLDSSASIPNSTASAPPGGVLDAYGVGGFVNCTKGSGEDIQAAKNFLLSLSTKQVYNGFTNNHTSTTMLVTSVKGPDVTYMPLGVVDLNPIRYVYPGTNNPSSYDLWVQLVISGKTNLVCNWSKSVQVNAPYP